MTDKRPFLGGSIRLPRPRRHDRALDFYDLAIAKMHSRTLRFLSPDNLLARQVALGVSMLVVLASAFCSAAPTATAQLQTLSGGNADAHWREAQLQAIDRQLAEDSLPDELKVELEAQKEWLRRWKHSSPGPETDVNAVPGAEDAAADPKANTAENRPRKKRDSDKLTEPILDPNERATELRKNLFANRNKPTLEDTASLQKALAEHSGDVGLRQLQLHWTDQPRYRNEYWKEISEASGRVVSLLAELPQTDESKAAAAFAYYRKARALAHSLRGARSEKPAVAGVAKLTTEDLRTMQDAIGDCGHQIEELVGLDRDEFFQLRIYLLRRDGWFGQALQLLDSHMTDVDESAYLQEKHAILQSLHWTGPAAQVASQLEGIELSKRRLLEIQFVPLESEEPR